MLPIATSIIVSLCLLINLMATNNIAFGVDTIIDISDSSHDINKKIEQLKEQNKQTSEYTKRYKKRKNYDSPTSSEIDDYKDSIIIEKYNPQQSETSTTEQPKPVIILKDTKPKIAIIIDDISNKKQLDSVTSIDMNLTPSIFPISPYNKNMIEAVNKLDFFMIHLPLEAKKYTDELQTIKVDSSTEEIQSIINNIIQTAPKTRYINNHTGSRFTESKGDMERLLRVLDIYNIQFIDSRTTPDSALNEIAKNWHRLILYRDIFIDNKLDRDSLNKQLEMGVEIAKKRGYAILIAHPHKETLEAIKEAKNSILKDIDIVYINELDRILKNSNVSTYSQKIHK